MKLESELLKKMSFAGGCLTVMSASAIDVPKEGDAPRAPEIVVCEKAPDPFTMQVKGLERKKITTVMIDGKKVSLKNIQLAKAPKEDQVKLRQAVAKAYTEAYPIKLNPKPVPPPVRGPFGADGSCPGCGLG